MIEQINSDSIDRAEGENDSEIVNDPEFLKYRRFLEESQLLHNKEEEAFIEHGWNVLNCERPFYHESTHFPDGHKRTVASTKTESTGPGFEWWWAKGDVKPQNGTTNYRSVFQVKDGFWVNILQENLD
ncbi:MAG: hypothetical protein Q7T49_03095 [bacterium]|nr:hypothetical protein [bacterium]